MTAIGPAHDGNLNGRLCPLSGCQPRASDRVKAVVEVIGEHNLPTVAANQLAESLLGNTIYANVSMLGFAWQSGLVPISPHVILRTIE